MILIILLGAATPSFIVGLIVGTMMSVLESDEKKKSKLFFKGLLYTTVSFTVLILSVGFYVKNF